MSNIDLTEAVEAAAEAFYNDYEAEGGRLRHPDTWERLNARCAGQAEPGYADHEIRADYERGARAAVTAAAPLIERAVRDQIAADIEAEKRAEEQRDLTPYSSGKFDGLAHAERIARGEVAP